MTWFGCGIYQNTVMSQAITAADTDCILGDFRPDSVSKPYANY